jgi:hypothetical protein
LDWTGEYDWNKCTSQVKGKPFTDYTAMLGSSECGKQHDSLFDGSTSNICKMIRNLRRPPAKSPSYAASTQEKLEYAELSQNSLPLMQDIKVMGVGEKKKNCVAFFGTGSNINLVCRAFAENLYIPATAVTQSHGRSLRNGRCSLTSSC